MATYRSMLELKIPSRRAASLTGVSRTTANRKPAPPRDQMPVVPQNKLSAAERAVILSALNSPEFVDLAPVQVYTKLLDQGIYLGSLSTFYRVLEDPGVRISLTYDTHEGPGSTEYWMTEEQGRMLGEFFKPSPPGAPDRQRG